jgi:hypothetical protein
MAPVLIAAQLVSLAAAGLFAGLFVRYRRRLHRMQGKLRWPIRTVDPGEFDDAFAVDELGPAPAGEAVVLGGTAASGGTSDREAWILAVLAKRAHRLFEFGTCAGYTTYVWARNSPADAEIATLTLPPDSEALYQAAAGDSRKAAVSALHESRFTQFRYSGTPLEAKVHQLFGDSKVFDETPYLGSCDLIFVDGSHAYSYVRSDTAKALRMIKPGGVILWHDYQGPSGSTSGVYRYLNELSQSLPLVHLRGTTLIAYRAPASAGDAAAPALAAGRASSIGPRS